MEKCSTEAENGSLTIFILPKLVLIPRSRDFLEAIAALTASFIIGPPSFESEKGVL